MKKFLSILFFCMYTMAVSGMVIQLHYCGGELESWQIASSEQKDCCCIGETPDNTHENIAAADDCCDNQEIKLQIDNDYNISIGELSIKILAPALFPQLITPHYENVTALLQEPLRNYQANAPPGLWQNIPLYSLNQSRLLYDVA